MSITYPIRFSDQLRQHLKGLRKKHGYTQAKLGQLLGVSQARIAEIEANPGLVNLDQLLQVFSALDATLSLEELQTDDAAAAEPAKARAGAKSPDLGQPPAAPGQKSAPLTAEQQSRPRSRDPNHQVRPPGPAATVQPESEPQPASERSLTLRPRKGFW